MEINRPSILIVDDDSSNVEVLSEILEPLYETYASKSRKEELSNVVFENPPDLVLLNVKMQKIDGRKVCRQLKESMKNRDAPVIFVTEKDDPGDLAKGFAIGAADYIFVPFDASVVRARVANQLKLARFRMESELRFKTLFEVLTDGVVVYDSEGFILQANGAFLENTGYRKEEIEGLSFFEMERDTENNSAPKSFGGFSKKRYGPYESLHARKDGSVFPVEVYARAVLHNGQPAALAVCRDVTERKKAERELENYRRRLEQLVKKRTNELREKKRKVAKLERSLKKRRRFGALIGKCEQMQNLYERIEVLANVSSSVLITGESGTGKDLVAEALHYGGVYRDKPLIRFSCSSMAGNMGESELFGHVKGAFAGADEDRIGLLEKAENGTLFLDEIADACPAFQKRLYRLLQEMAFERVGGDKPIGVEARLVAATHRNLDELVRQGEFREDLYYRLKMLELKIPPLRNRREDIPLLADHFLSVFSKESNKEIREVSPEALIKLMSRDWPGNVRELKHTIEQAFVLCEGSVIKLEDLLADPRATAEIHG